MRTIRVGPESATMVDDDDYEVVSSRGWTRRADGYAWARIRGKWVSLHRFLMEPANGQEVDHRDGNPLNNQRANLRLCTRRENALNVRPFRGRSRFKGVSPAYHRRRDGATLWKAQIHVHGKQIYLGYHDDEVQAALAYDAAAAHHFGAFAYLNFPSAA